MTGTHAPAESIVLVAIARVELKEAAMTATYALMTAAAQVDACTPITQHHAMITIHAQWAIPANQEAALGSPNPAQGLATQEHATPRQGTA